MNIVAKAEIARGKITYILFSTERDNITHYGIQVCSTLFGSETETLYEISSDIIFSKRLMLILADNIVLPSTFKEVVEEFLAVSATV